MMSLLDGVKSLFFGSDNGWLRRRSTFRADKLSDQLMSDYNVTRATTQLEIKLEITPLILDQIRGQVFSLRIELDHVKAASVNNYLRYYNKKIK